LIHLPRALRLSKRLGVFLAGQAAAQVVGAVAGLVILWLLTPREYALYIVSMTVLAIGSLSSDLGTSQAVITCGAKAQSDPEQLASIYAAAQRIRRTLYWLGLATMLALGGVMMFGGDWPWHTAVLCLLVVVVMNLFQQRANLGTSVLNIHQDIGGRFHTIFWSNSWRLLLSLTLFVWPVALIAVLITLAGFVMQDIIVGRRVRRLIPHEAPPTADSLAEVRNFFIPLIPGVIYYMVQGQLSVILLSWSGNTVSIAEVGALGRLGQVLALAGLLNNFFVQSHFAQIRDERIFTRRAIALLATVFLGSGLLVLSTMTFPAVWLFILGPHYDHLKSVLPWAVGGALSYTIAATIYTIVVATGNTRLQWLQIPFGLGSQLLFVYLYGVNTTREGVILNALPAFTALLLELALLIALTRTLAHQRKQDL
jgi:O-antigen/teichoic acid export membrane protein